MQNFVTSNLYVFIHEQVYFPDIEKAEWLNKIIKQMWPYVGNYTQQLLKTTVEATVQNSLPKSLTPFKFEKIDLGDIVSIVKLSVIYYNITVPSTVARCQRLSALGVRGCEFESRLNLKTDLLSIFLLISETQNSSRRTGTTERN